MFGKSKQSSTDSASKDTNGFFGQGTSFEGNLRFQGVLRIDGDFTGEIESDGILVIGEKARLSGEFQVGQLFLNGIMNGKVTAREKVVLHRTAHLECELSTPKLVVDERAVFNGQLSMGSGKKADAGALEAAAAKAVSDGGTSLSEFVQQSGQDSVVQP